MGSSIMSGTTYTTTNQTQTHASTQGQQYAQSDLGLTVIGILASGSMFLWVISKAFSKAVASSSQGLVNYFIQNEFHKPMKEIADQNANMQQEIATLNVEIENIHANYAKTSDINSLSSRILNLETSTNEIKNQSIKILVKLQEAELRQDQKDSSYKKDLHYLELIIENHEKHTAAQIGYLEKITNNVVQSNTQLINLYNREDNRL